MGGGYPIEISPLSASDALTIYEIHSNLKKDFDPVPIVLGLLQLSSVTDQPQILVALRELQESHPAQSANAIELLLDRAPSPMPNGFGGQITPNESLTSQAMRMLCEGHPEPITAALSLARMLWQKRMPHGFDERLILAEATPLFERIVRETDLEDAPDGQARLAYAARFLAMGRIVSNESLVILLSQLRDFTPEGKLNRLSDWPVEEDTKFDHASRSARWSLGSNYYLALQQIIANNPASSVEAMNIELEHGIASSAKYCSLLLPSLYDIHDDRAEIETPDETRAQRKQWRQWIATQQGRESLKRLAVQFSAALENVRQDAQTNSSQQATDTIDGLTATIVGIAQALKQDLSQYPAAATALRELVELESTRPIEESFNTRTERNLQAYAKLQGNDQVPLAAILRWAWSQQTATPLASQLIEEIRASRPAEFDAYFLAQLEAARIEHFQGLANLYRRNRSTIAIWHLVVGNLMQSPELREQTIAAINQLIELANGDEFITQPLRSLLRQ